MKAIDFFREISAIPRGSGNEGAIASYIEKIASDHGLFCVRDSFNNIFVRKKASVGFEDHNTVAFTAHTDMVCEKTASSQHDFLTDPITLIEKDGYVYADGTTLGADDGAGVAAMLDLMTDPKLCAPETEYIFTSSEETGMDGAHGFDYSLLHANTVINLDSCGECTACIGCASGQRYSLKIPVDRTRKCGKAVTLTVRGLAGGHSGGDIALGRSSAIKLFAQLLDELYSAYPFHVVQFSGGGKDNVIPASASATVIFYGDGDEKRADRITKDFEARTRRLLTIDDRRHFSARLRKSTASETEAMPDMLTLKSTSALISTLMLSPQGVISMIPDTNDVMASVNLGIASLCDEAFTCTYLARASVQGASDQTVQTLERLSHVLGGSLIKESGHPGWDYKRGGALQDAYIRTCHEVFGRRPDLTAVHAGLECGIFYEKLHSLGKEPEIISIGPNIYDIHTTAEKLDVASLDRLALTLRKLLQKL